MLFSSDKIPLCIYFIMCHIVMANLEWTRLHCPWDRRICFANRSDEGNQTNDAPISVTMMRLSLSLCLCARKMAHGSSLSAIKKTYKEYVCVHNAHYHRFEVTWFWNRLKRCFHRWQCFGMLSSVYTVQPPFEGFGQSLFSHLVFVLAASPNAQKMECTQFVRCFVKLSIFVRSLFA